MLCYCIILTIATKIVFEIDTSISLQRASCDVIRDGFRKVFYDHDVFNMKQ